MYLILLTVPVFSTSVSLTFIYFSFFLMPNWLGEKLLNWRFSFSPLSPSLTCSCLTFFFCYYIFITCFSTLMGPRCSSFLFLHSFRILAVPSWVHSLLFPADSLNFSVTYSFLSQCFTLSRVTSKSFHPIMSSFGRQKQARVVTNNPKVPVA